MGILDEEEDQEVEDRSSEDEDDEYTTPYWEKNWINNDGDNGTRKSKKSKKQKGASKKTRKYDEQRRRKEDISITMSGLSLIFCLFVWWFAVRLYTVTSIRPIRQKVCKPTTSFTRLLFVFMPFFVSLIQCFSV